VPVTERIGDSGRSSTCTDFRARRGGDDEGMCCGGGDRGVAPFFRVGEGRRCGAVRGTTGGRGALSRHRLLEGGDDGASSIQGGNEEEAMTHLFLFPLGTGGRQTEA
jgi:hypothetical protein